MRNAERCEKDGLQYASSTAIFDVLTMGKCTRFPWLIHQWRPMTRIAIHP